MSFITAVAGPSRLPYGAQAARTCAAAAHGAQRGYAAPARRSREGEGEVDVWTAKPIEGAGPAGKTRESKPEDFIGWLRKVGWEYRRPEPGQRARWLGKHVVSKRTRVGVEVCDG
jgi:hypothetical protein